MDFYYIILLILEKKNSVFFNICINKIRWQKCYFNYNKIINFLFITFFQFPLLPSPSPERKHPVYEYDFPAPYLRDQEWFPLRRPFNLYMDKYRDPKQVAKEYLARKLARTHPFEGPEPALRFPNAHPVPREVPSWLTTQIKKDRRGWGRVNDV